MTIMIIEDRTRNNVSIDGVTLPPSAKYAERQLVYTAHESVDKRDDKVDKTGEQISEEKTANAPRK